MAVLTCAPIVVLKVCYRSTVLSPERAGDSAPGEGDSSDRTTERRLARGKGSARRRSSCSESCSPVNSLDVTASADEVLAHYRSELEDGWTVAVGDVPTGSPEGNRSNARTPRRP